MTPRFSDGLQSIFGPCHDMDITHIIQHVGKGFAHEGVVVSDDGGKCQKNSMISKALSRIGG